MSKRGGNRPRSNIEQKSQKTISQHSQQVKVELSPFLLPETLEKYEAIKEGFAERTIKMAEGEQSHRQDLEKKSLEANIELNKLTINNEYKAKRFGQSAATSISILGLVGGIVLVLFDKSIEGFIAFLPALGTLSARTLSNFWRRESSSKELEKQ